MPEDFYKFYWLDLVSNIRENLDSEIFNELFENLDYIMNVPEEVVFVSNFIPEIFSVKQLVINNETYPLLDLYYEALIQYKVSLGRNLNDFNQNQFLQSFD